MSLRSQDKCASKWNGRPPDGDHGDTMETPCEYKFPVKCEGDADDMRRGCDNDLDGDANEANHSNGSIELGYSNRIETSSKLVAEAKSSNNKRDSIKLLSTRERSNRKRRFYSLAWPEESSERKHISESIKQHVLSIEDQSITSDYFSSSFNSPIVEPKKKTKNLADDVQETSVASRQLIEKERRGRRRRRASTTTTTATGTTTIYENPGFARDEYERGEEKGSKMSVNLQAANSLMKSTRIGESSEGSARAAALEGTSVNSNYSQLRADNLTFERSSSSSSSASSSSALSKPPAITTTTTTSRKQYARDQSADHPLEDERRPYSALHTSSSEFRHILASGTNYAPNNKSSNPCQVSNLARQERLLHYHNNNNNSQLAETKSGQQQLVVGLKSRGGAAASMDYDTPTSHLQQQAPELGHQIQAPPLNETRNGNLSQLVMQPQHYYYSPSVAANQHRQARQKSELVLSSQASSQLTTTTDESPSNTTDGSANNRLIYNCQQNHQQQADLSDYHYYQVVVPSGTKQATNGDPYQQRAAMPGSPCKSIQRIVSSLFSQNNHLSPHPYQLPPIPTINQNLVTSQPIIGSTKTLIDIRQQQQQLGYLNKQQTLPRYVEQQQQQQQPIELSSIPDELRDKDHYYCGVSTLQRGGCNGAQQDQIGAQYENSPPLAHYREAELNHSFHTLVDKMNDRHIYQVHSLSATQNAHQFMPNRLPTNQYRIQSSAGSSSDPNLSKLNGRRRISCSNRICLFLFLLSTLACCLLFALLSNYKTPISDKDTNLLIQGGTQITTTNTNARRDPTSIMNEFKPPLYPPHLLAQPGGLLTQTTTVIQAISPPPTTTTATSPPALVQKPGLELNEAGEFNAASNLTAPQNYWLLRAVDYDEPAINQCSAEGGSEQAGCSLKGFCDNGACACLAGFSGSSCNIANCPNECSRRGECKLRPDSALNRLGAGQLLKQQQRQVGGAHLESFGYATQWSSRARNSLCPEKSESEFNQSWAIKMEPPERVFDNRLEWQCVCQVGFTGLDCSQAQELRCDDGSDDDNDGLIDCEDDDCCTQAVCRENLMCFKSPEPAKILSSSQATTNFLSISDLNRTNSSAFYTQMRFLIANDSVQSYTQERDFDKSRVAVIKGKVVKSTLHTSSPADLIKHEHTNLHDDGNGIVSVRVGVVESVGFTLTRNDGSFDMLVNGNEWITLQLHKHAYVPIERKIFVKAHSINVLEEELQMFLASGSNLNQQQQQQQQYRPLDSSFGLKLELELYKLAANAYKRDEERKRNLLYDCLSSSLSHTNFMSHYEPLLVDLDGENVGESLKSFAMANAGAYTTQLDAHWAPPGSSYARRFLLSYNSAHFSPAASVVKPTISIQLLPADYGQESNHFSSQKLNAILVQLDIEGQSRRKRLEPSAKLTYQFSWNRRNVYGLKVYGFSELNVRIGYEYQLKSNKSSHVLWNECLSSNQMLDSSAHQHQQQDFQEKLKLTTILANPNLDKQVVWFERKIYMEAHQLNQHSDVGKWTLLSSNRLDLDREIIYFGSGWSLPYKLVYPPVVSEPIPLMTGSQEQSFHRRQLTQSNSQDEEHMPAGAGSRLLTRGPGSSVFILRRQSQQLADARLIQLDSNNRRQLLNVPLATLTGKLFQPQPQQHRKASQDYAFGDIQIVYNNYISTLYLSSRASGKIIQISYASLLAFNKTLSGSSSMNSEDEIDIEPLCGFGQQLLSTSSRAESIRAARSTRLVEPHSMALDEERQILYFVEGSNTLVALDLNSQHVALILSSHQTSSAIKTSRFRSRFGAKADCSRSHLRIPFKDFKANQMHSLSWSKADSSLYFIDQSMVLALRQDLTLELIALGFSKEPQQAFVYFPSAASCFDRKEKTQLGTIKHLLVDEAENDLLIVHQWNADLSRNEPELESEPKINARFYLAKVKLGINSANVGARGKLGASLPLQVFDLHSAESTWNQMILQMAIKQKAQLDLSSFSIVNSSTKLVNWNELANTKQQQSFFASSQNLSGQQSPMIPFIHLSKGFRWIDSIEINSDGSIFVLDSGADLIKLVSAYSPSNFNLVERHDVNINRLFASNVVGDPAFSVGQKASMIERSFSPTINRATDDESRKLNVLIVQNPLSGELMEFHSSSGLQLSLTSNSIKSEFYYKILTNNKQATITTGIATELDEDDKYDFDMQRLILNYMLYSNEDFQKNYNNNYANIRLSKILDSKKNEAEFVRLYTGTRHVLQNILINNQQFCEIATDYMGVLNTYQQPGKNYWFEIVYDSLTYLIRDIITKVDLTTAQALNSYSPNILSSQEEQLSNSNNNNALTRDWRQLKRIVYDRVFYHYCDLFIVNA